MTKSVSSALRRAGRAMRPTKLARKALSMHTAMAGLMMAPMTSFKPKAARMRKTGVKKSIGPLGAVISQLQAMQSLLPKAKKTRPRSSPPPAIPKGAQYLTRTHRCASGSRGYQLYLPSSHSSHSSPPKGLILMLHGCNQNPNDFAIGTHMNNLAERHGLAIAWPAQSGRQNSAQCWNWFRPGHQARGAGEPAILASLARKLAGEFGLSRDAVFVAGLSAGGAMAAILADVYPDVFSAAGVHSGLARGTAGTVLSAMVAMRNGGGTPAPSPISPAPLHPVRRIIFQGDADETVHPSNAAMIVAAAIGSDREPARVGKRSVRGRGYVRSDYAGPDGATVLELWMLDGAGHTWSGGRIAGSYTDSTGPDASAQMIRFFLTRPA